MSPAKTQISLGIHLVLSVHCLPEEGLGPLIPRVHSEDWSDWADGKADLRLLGAQIILLVLSCSCSSIIILTTRILKIAVIIL